MEKRDREFKEHFQRAESVMEIDHEKKEEAFWVFQQAVEEKSLSFLHSRKQIFINQFCYMDKTIWGILGILYGAVILLLVKLYGVGIEREGMIVLAMVLAAGMGAFSILGICNAFYSDLAELSGSCYFNVGQMMLFRMVCFGVVNLAVLLAGILFVGYRWEIPFVQIGLYVLVPFLFTQCSSLAAALTEAGRKNPFWPALAGIFTAVFCGGMAMFPEIYEASALLIWEIAFGAGSLILGLQIKRLFRVVEEGEILCMN